MSSESNNTIEHKQDINTSQKIENFEEKFLLEEEKLNKLKNSPELYKRGKEELEEFKKSFKEIKGENIGEINNIKKEFKNDIKGLINISKIAPKDFREKLGHNIFTDEQEEKLYDLFKKKKRFIGEFIKFEGELPKDKTDFDSFIKALEKRKILEKEYISFSDALGKIDFEKVSKKELKEYIEQIKKYEGNFDLSKINDFILSIKNTLQERILEEIKAEKKEDVAEKKEDVAEKKEDVAEKKEDVVEKNKKLKIDILKTNKTIEKYKNIKDSISDIDGLESLFIKIYDLNVDEKLNIDIDEKELNEKIKNIGKLELYLQKNAGKIVKSIIEADIKSGKIKKNAEGKIIFKAPDSLYNKLISQFTNISPLVKQAFEPYLIDTSPVTPIERDLISSVSGDKLDISKMRKIGEGKYMFDGKEFDISENGELTTYSVDKYGHKIELGNLGKDDLEPLEDIKGEFSEKKKRLKNLGEEYNNKLIELRQVENEKPVDENKINELKRVLFEKKKRIEKLVKIIDELKKDLKKEKQKLSNFISKEKLEKVKKSEKILNDTGLSRFFPQSVIDEIFARINLSPSLRQELGFDTKIDFSEGELGFNKIGESENEYRRRFAKFVNSIISANENEPLDINQIGLGRIGYGENELSVKIMITENLTSGLIGYDIVKIFDNLKKI